MHARKNKNISSQNQIDFIYFGLDMNKTKVEIYEEVLRDGSRNFEDTKEFIKQRIQEICDWKKISVEEVVYFLYI